MKKLLATILLVLAAFTMSACGNGDIYSDSECHDAYVHDYAAYGTTEAMSEEDYCKSLNDTSYLPDEMP